MSEQIDTATDQMWLSQDDLDTVRGRVPMVYVEAMPVRLDDYGEVTHVGLLLRAMADGTISRSVVSGRVLWGETIRQALFRHLTKDLGPAANPRIPASPVPFSVIEYMQDPMATGFHDPRQHAVSLAYVVPIEGFCEPSQDVLEFDWLTCDEAAGVDVAAEMTGGQDRLVRLGLAHVGQLP